MMHWSDGHGWAMGWGWIFMVLFWALAIFGALALLRRGSSAGDGESRRRPIDILDERYARGEINKEEYEQKKRDIES